MEAPTFSYGSFVLRPNLSEVTQVPGLETLISALNTRSSGGSVLISGINILQHQDSLLIRTLNVTQHIPRSRWNDVRDWLSQILVGLRSTNIGYLARLPQELQQQLLLSYDYPEIIRVCEQIPDLSWICSSTAFWVEKARQLGVEAREFRETQLSPRERYLQLLAVRRGECYRGSERYTGIETCLLSAVRRGDLNLVEYLLERPHDQNARVRALRSATFEAAERGHTDVVYYLLEKGAPVEAAAPIVRFGDPNLLQLLRERGVGSETLLYNLAYGGQRELFNQLLGKRWNPAVMAQAFVFAVSGGQLDLARELYARIARQPDIAETVTKAFISAAAEGRLEGLRYLLELNPDMTRIDYAVDVAAQEGDLPTLRFLLEIPELRPYGDRALTYAASRNQLPVVEYLLSQGFGNPQAAAVRAMYGRADRVVDAMLRRPDIDLDALLRDVAEEVDIGRYLGRVLEAGATNVNAALIAAARGGSVENVRYLVSRGATSVRAAIQALQEATSDEGPGEEDEETLAFLQSLPESGESVTVM